MLAIPKKKYILLLFNGVITSCEIKLYQIKALIDIPKVGVKKGDLGGYIENETNLDQNDDSWIGENAKVFGGAQVFGAGTQILNFAEVSGPNTRVYMGALVSDPNTRVINGAEVWGPHTSVRNGALVEGESTCVIHGASVANASVTDGAILAGTGVSLNHGARVWGSYKKHFNGNALDKGNAQSSKNASFFTRYVSLLKKRPG